MLPYGRQWIDDDDVAAVVAALRGDLLTTGPATVGFERALAETVNSPHAVVCSNGTAALHLAALALGLGPGDRVIVPAVTFLATANAVRYVGAEVVFADVDPDNGLLTPETLLAAAARADGPVKAVFPVHLAGQPVDMEAIAAQAAERGWRVVEDACHALGTRWTDSHGKEHWVGECSHSDMAVFSFHPVKTVTMGEGGAISLRDPAMAEALARLRSHGMSRTPADFTETEQAFDADGSVNPWYYEMAEPGFNYRACDLQCALGTSQMAKLGRFVQRRGELVARYDRLLAPLAPLVAPIKRRPNVVAGWHLYPVLVDFAAAGMSRAQFMRTLSQDGIGTQVHYLPVNRQSYYRRRYGKTVLPGADRYYERTLSLPLFPAMSDAEVDGVVAALQRALRL